MDTAKLNDQIFTLLHEVEEGIRKGAEAYALLHTIEGMAKSAKKEVQDFAISELDGESDPPAYHGLRPTVQSRAVWSYDSPERDRLKENLKSFEKQMQKSYQHLRKHGQPLVDQDGVEIPPAEQKHTTYIKCEVAK